MNERKTGPQTTPESMRRAVAALQPAMMLLAGGAIGVSIIDMWHVWNEMPRMVFHPSLSRPVAFLAAWALMSGHVIWAAGNVAEKLLLRGFGAALAVVGLAGVFPQQKGLVALLLVLAALFFALPLATVFFPDRLPQNKDESDDQADRSRN